MVAANFPEANTVLGAPKGMEDTCDPLNVCITEMDNGQPMTISCFKLTQDELDEFKATGRIWLMVAAAGMPPVILTSKCPFVRG